MKIAIVGTAFRKQDAKYLTKELYFKMVRDAKTQVGIYCLRTSEYLHLEGDNVGQLDISVTKQPVELVSGGAAGADHIAVSLYLMNVADSLTLHLPCGWNHDERYFHGSVANTANYYHQQFSKKLGKDPLQTLDELITTMPAGFSHKCHNGFKARNLEVGKADVLLAYTFGTGDKPGSPGTLHTWDNSPAQLKVHRRIQEL